ncbi:hypothetical protein A9P44_12255 [Paenibacillus polymyxa]|nr:hypothetical protein AV545_01730 [Paenibacillus jamilae]OBA06582.1 hypothetical protein A9P44_12255 [Paenibacillus polymyxa]
MYNTRIKLMNEAYRLVQDYYGGGHFYRKSLMSSNDIALCQDNVYFASEKKESIRSMALACRAWKHNKRGRGVPAFGVL